MTDLELRQMLLNLSAAQLAQKDLLVDALAMGDPAAASQLAERYTKFYNHHLQRLLEQYEDADPAAAAQLDWRKLTPPL